jgi:enoyl-CoA hydratase/carnithine racemase
MSLLFVEASGGVTTLVINRPEKRNAFNHEMWVQLSDLVDQATEDDKTKVLVLRSSDQRAFSAGADISELRQMHGDPTRMATYNQDVRKAENTLAGCPKPTIAMISGFCVGGGCAIAVACDFRFADSTSTFGITPAKLGIVYSLVGTKRLVDLVGPTNAKLLLMSGNLLDAERSQSIGLLTELCDPSHLIETTYAFAKTVASRAQLTVRSAKSIVDMILKGAHSETDESRTLQERALASDDYREGVEAFLEGRTPRFT